MPQCKCGNNLEETDQDCRQTWFLFRYWCSNCNKFYIRTITFKAQTDLVESDKLEEDIKINV